MGDLENTIMDVLWEQDGWLTPAEVHTTLTVTRPLAYTTVTTVLVRLWRKGRLQRQADGRAYAYRPVVTREQHAAVLMHDSLAAGGNQARALTFFLESLTPSERAQLRRLLKERGGPA
jgi:predicted transcriptional regulator